MVKRVNCLVEASLSTATSPWQEDSKITVQVILWLLGLGGSGGLNCGLVRCTEVQGLSFVGYTGVQGGRLRLWNLQNLWPVPPYHSMLEF